ncbi:NUDIX hydrolase [Paenibacillus whitsoniae]|uniref:NUDIX domain-containing protein n=1 Tax=Paenibacillus whitsoniae TaxID=2496558 RepID=A0A3S0C916_9BACL|nr:NUDIX hydrolase [Paenibacillus whitsoniae]RTE07168.1 NUDIX domain-containing protein [Paenibacillus whitsoniae]
MEYYKQLRAYVGHQPLILPGAVAIIVNREGDILLQKRNQTTWGLPGGLMELGESFEDTVRREVLEETGLTLGMLTMLNVYSGADYHIKMANGDEFYAVTAVYITEEFSGELQVDEIETHGLEFFALGDMPDTVGKSYRKYLQEYQARR